MYASCEKVFDPSLRNKPVVVLTNNDGCICSICSVGKAMGLTQKFQPYFKVKDELERLGVAVRSSNYELYGDLSQRMMMTCQRFAPSMHVYSIDECFLGFEGYQPEEGWLDYGKQIRKTVWKEVRLPIGIGIGDTPTLAKVASHAAKKMDGFNGVAAIATEQERLYILRNMDVGDVWGIGRRLSVRLNLLGIKSAYQLAEADPKMIKKHFGRPVLDTLLELNGQQRIFWDVQSSKDGEQESSLIEKKQIMSTRSFGQRISKLEDIKRELANHVSIVCRKLRKQNSLAVLLTIFIGNSRHDAGMYKKSQTLVPLLAPSADNKIILKAVMTAVEQIFRSDVRYYRCGVGAVDIIPERYYQTDLFVLESDNKPLMKEFDKINYKYGAETLFIARQFSNNNGVQQKLSMRRNFMSKRATTNILEIPKIY